MPWKRISYWEEELSFLPEGEWAGAGSHRGMTQDKMNLDCKDEMSWNMDFFLREKDKVFARGWENRDESEKSMTQEFQE